MKVRFGVQMIGAFGAWRHREFALQESDYQSYCGACADACQEVLGAMASSS